MAATSNTANNATNNVANNVAATRQNGVELKLAALASLGAKPASTLNTAGASDAKTPPSTLWANIGYHDEVEGRINLPYNLPIEHMKYKDASGKSPDWAVQAQLANLLLDQLRELALSLEPGQRITLPVNFTIELYRSEDRNATANSEDVQARLAAAKARMSFNN